MPIDLILLRNSLDMKERINKLYHTELFILP
jgi:hypothetical protein